MKKRILVSLLCVWTTSTVWARAQDEVDMLRKYPPSFMAGDSISSGLLQIRWNQELSERKLKELNDMQSELIVELDRSRAMIESLASNMDPEFRYVSESARAAAAGSCLEEIMKIRLELATKEAMLQQLGESSEQASDTALQRRRQQLRVQQVESNVQLLKRQITLLTEQLEKAQQLSEADFLSNSSLDEIKLNLATRESELQSALLELQIVGEEAQTQPQDPRAANLRLEIKALQAREKSAKKFLDSLNKTAVVNREITGLKQHSQLALEDLKHIRASIIDAEQTLVDYKNLVDQVKSAVADPERYKIEK